MPRGPILRKEGYDWLMQRDDVRRTSGSWRWVWHLRSLEKWAPPSVGVYKLNVDGSQTHSSREMGIGGVLGNPEGCWLWGFSGNCGFGSSLHAELLALRLSNEIAEQRVHWFFFLNSSPPGFSNALVRLLTEKITLALRLDLKDAAPTPPTPFLPSHTQKQSERERGTNRIGNHNHHHDLASNDIRYDVVSFLSQTLNQVGSNNGVDRKMDRSKSRTDLLAAGRKKFLILILVFLLSAPTISSEKDSKGGSSRGKSSKTSGKPQIPESDADAASSTSISTGSSHVTDGNVETDSDSNVLVTESVESQSLANSSAPDTLQDHGVRENDSELSAQDQGESAQDVGADVAKDMSLRASDSLGPEGRTTNDHASESVAILTPPASVTTAVGQSVTVEREGEKREELLLLSEDVPNTFVMQTREDQEFPLFKAGEGNQSLSGIALENTRHVEASLEAEQLGKPVELLSSLEDTASDKLSVEDPYELPKGAHEVNLARPFNLSPTFDVSSVNLFQLAEIIKGLNEEEYQFLLKARGAVSDADPLTSSSVLPLAEQLELQLESDNQRHQLIGELSQLHASHNEVNEKYQCLTEELANCRVELHNISSKSVELQNQFNTAMAEVEALSVRVVELQISFEVSQKDSLDLSTELADCRGLISSLQAEKKGMDETLDLVIAEKNKLVEEKDLHLCESKKVAAELADFKTSMEAAENSSLNGNLALSADKIKDLEDDNQSVVLENQRISSQIVALQEQLSVEKGERMKFEGDLNEATIHMEQLSKENVLLNSTLDEHKAKIEEIGKKHSQSLSQPGDLGNQAHVAWEQSKGLEIAITGDSVHIDQEPDEGASGGPLVNIPEHEVFNDILGFVSMKTCSDEVDKVLVELEKAINELHSQSVFSRRSGERVSSPVVSKLIQAFESKGYEDEDEVDARDSNDVQSSPNSFIMLAKEQIGNLRKLLSKWKLDVQSAAALFKEERDGRKIGDAKYNDLNDQFEGFKQHCSDLEASNIELAVQYELQNNFWVTFKKRNVILRNSGSFQAREYPSQSQK
ncbi:hypothetical protein SESBI_10802 [Sesbania bispinosa]|nr:hypothetical protein SESBI_10802 [Sesbania bispinosa]